jgi:ketosteroid isomerase-like protein
MLPKSSRKDIMRKVLLGLAFFGALLAATVPASAKPPAASAQKVVTEFLDAFNALDVPRFDRFFAPDVTMFFPQAPIFPAGRIDGKAAVTEMFHRYFDSARRAGQDHLDITPQNLEVQQIGNVAVASFELAGKDRLGRRSIVLRRDREGWRIVHFHASSVDKAAK